MTGSRFHTADLQILRITIQYLKLLGHLEPGIYARPVLNMY